MPWGTRFARKGTRSPFNHRAQNFVQILIHFLLLFPFAKALMKMGIGLTQLQSAVAEPFRSSSNPPENVILIPYMNPIKQKNRTRKIESYKLSSAEPGRESTDPWTITMAHTADRLRRAFDDFAGLRNFFVAFLFSFLATLVLVAIIGGLSKFHLGHSTHA